MTFSQVLAKVVFACGLERASRNDTWIFSLANPVSSMHMSIEVRSKSKLVVTSIAEVWFRVGLAMLTSAHQQQIGEHI
jgi:hypothetical protein